MQNEFIENTRIQVTAAQIGISTSTWDFVDEDFSKNEARELMENNGYDILPIKSKCGNYKYYWTTSKSGDFDNILKEEISSSKIIYYLTELKDLLLKFQESNNSSYFLSNYNGINGLVSNVNLNSKSVYIYFYSLISSCEIDLGLWLKKLIPEKDLIHLIEEKSKNDKDTLSPETLNRYNEDKLKNRENHFVEYLYFSQFEFIIKSKNLTSALGFTSNKKFSKTFKIIKEYRNWFAHPLNSPTNDMSSDFHELHNALTQLLSNIRASQVDLLKAYFETTYETNKKPKFVISIGQVNEKLNAYLKQENQKSWAFITGENPRSLKSTHEENQKQNSFLEARLKKQNFIFFEGKGIPKNEKWKPENSFLILNITKKKAIEFSREFQQNAFVFGEIDQAPELIRLRYER